MNTEIPQNMAAYFQAHPEQFVLKADVAKKSTYGLIFAVCLVLMIKPDLIPVGELWIWRVIAWIGMGFAGFSFFLASDYYNKQTQTKIKQKGHKKFDSGHTTVEELSPPFRTRQLPRAGEPTFQEQPTSTDVCL